MTDAMSLTRVSQKSEQSRPNKAKLPKKASKNFIEMNKNLISATKSKNPDDQQ